MCVCGGGGGGIGGGGGVCVGGVVCAGVWGLWTGGGGWGGWVWLRMWCVGRARGGGDSHSQAKDNAVCVCVCVYGGAGGVCGVFGPGAYGLGVCVRVCACACACARARVRVRGGGGGGAPGCVCVCTRWVQAGCVCGYACGVFLWVVRAETEAESRSQAKDDAVGVWYGHGVCVCGGGVVCVWCVWWAGRDRSSQAKDHVHGWISRIICLCFLSSFSTSAIKTTPVKCESAPTSQHLSLARQTGECSELGGGGRGSRLAVTRPG